MTKDEEQTLVRRAQKDPEVFGKIFDLHYQKIFGYVLRRTADVFLAKDITSETFYKALRNLWKFKWRNISLAAWLYRIAANEVNYYFRNRKYKTVSLEKLRETEGFDPAGRTDLEEELIRAEQKIQQNKDYREIQKYLAELPLQYQEVLALKYFEGKKIREICELTGKKEGTVKSLLSRGIQQLKVLCTGT